MIFNYIYLRQPKASMHTKILL